MKLTSAYRSPVHNKKVGGTKNSMHLQAKAFDVQMAGHDPTQFEAAAREVGFTGFGFYKESNFIHIDTGRAREWGIRWFPKAMHYEGKMPRPDMAQLSEAESVTPPVMRPTVLQALFGTVVLAIAAFVAKLFGG